MKRDAAYTISAVASLAAAVTLLTLLPEKTIAYVPAHTIEEAPAYYDKIQHAVAFGAIIAPAALAQPKWIWRLIPAIALLCAIIEIIQPLVDRKMEFTDWVASMFGVAITSALLTPAGFLAKRVNSLNKQHSN